MPHAEIPLTRYFVSMSGELVHPDGHVIVDRPVYLPDDVDPIRDALRDWRTWAQFVYLSGGSISGDDTLLRSAVCERHDAALAALRQQVTALTQERDEALLRLTSVIGNGFWANKYLAAKAEADALRAERDALQTKLTEVRQDAKNTLEAERSASNKTVTERNTAEARVEALTAVLQQIRRDFVDVPAIGLGDGKFYRSVPDERVADVEAVLAASGGGA